ncbi:MAG: hypothetical protein RR906_06565 [Acetivibrio sp.]
MKEIKREQHLKQLLSFKWDGQIKVITGIRRFGIEDKKQCSMLVEQILKIKFIEGDIVAQVKRI